MLLGAALALIAVTAAVLAVRAPSAVEARLAQLAPDSAPRRWIPVADRDLEHAGIPVGGARMAAMKLVGGLAGACAGSVLALVLPSGVVGIVGAAYVGFILPSLWVERRARNRRVAADRRVGALVEWLEALVAAGRPAETALTILAERPSGAPVLDRALRDAATSYALGAPLFRGLATAAATQGLPALGELATALERSRSLGRGTLALVRDLRDRLRAQERSRSLDAASRVEGSLMLILALCYLPALMLLVVVPLFVSLLRGLALT